MAKNHLRSTTGKSLLTSLTNEALKKLWAKLRLAKPRPLTKAPLAKGIANFGKEHCSCVSKPDESVDTFEGSSSSDLDLDDAGIPRKNFFENLSDSGDEANLPRENTQIVRKRRRIDLTMDDLCRNDSDTQDPDFC